MADLKKYEGIIPAFYACYDAEGGINAEAVRKLTRWFIEKGVQGVYVGGSSGECIYQSVAERKLVLENVIVKGLRAGSDFENEFQMALINRKINPELDTMFLTSEHQFTYLSSSMVKELGSYDVDLTDFLPAAIIPDFRKRIEDIRQGGNT